MTTTASTVSTTASTSTTPAMKTVGKNTLDRNDFMKLFITQMQNQDPLEPMKGTDMATQLAQFSTLDSMQNMSNSMDQLLNYQTSQNNLQLLSLIGKTVQGKGSSMGVLNGAVTPTQYSLANTADSCQVNIYNAAGTMVDSMDLGPASSGSHDLSWDGKMPNGTVVPDGEYTYTVTAMSNGQQVNVDYRTTGQVTGVNFSGSQAQVTVDNSVAMNVADILAVK
ncbi:MAG: flagellar hook assembly protein FlgD [Desulfurivibrionaceae bacterium]